MLKKIPRRLWAPGLWKAVDLRRGRAFLLPLPSGRNAKFLRPDPGNGSKGKGEARDRKGMSSYLICEHLAARMSFHAAHVAPTETAPGFLFCPDCLLNPDHPELRDFRAADATWTQKTFMPTLQIIGMAHDLPNNSGYLPSSIQLEETTCENNHWFLNFKPYRKCPTRNAEVKFAMSRCKNLLASDMISAMKTILALALSASIAASQTKVNLNDLRTPTTPGARFVILTSTGLLFVQPDPAGSVVIDTTVSPPIIRAVTVLPPFPQQLEFNVPVIVAPTQVMPAIADTPLPSMLIQVLRNGLMMTAPGDYTFTARVVTFTAAQTIQPGDMIKIIYWK
ncbi:hypothetical protein EPO44_10285 [bacterium]|nr:MAG: hypothetical protein EPO44_10285 [bacterium]